MRIGVFGGSFHPPHVGHAMVASWLHWTDQVDEVWFVPVFRHAFDKALAPFSQRVALCEAMCGDLGGWARVCDVERDLPAPSFTVQTLQELARLHPGAEIRLVVGSDVLPDTPRWRDWTVIQSEFRPIVVARTGYAEVEGSPSFPLVSSTDIRARLADGRPVDHLLSRRVRAALGGGLLCSAAEAPATG